MHKIILITFLALLLGSCANKDAKLVGDTSNIYPGGLLGQRINGDDNSVTIWNLWNARDGKPVAEQHCRKYGKKVISMSFSNITGYYKCGFDSKIVNAKEIFKDELVQSSVSIIRKCIIENIPKYDDLRSDAKNIAESMKQICTSQFNNFSMLFISKIPGNNQWNNETKNRFKNILEKGQTRQILPFVLKWRSLVRNGWDKKKAPTSKTMPNIFLEPLI